MRKGVPEGSLADATRLASTNSIPQKSDLSTPAVKKYDLADDGKKTAKKTDEVLNENGEVKDEYFAAAVRRMYEDEAKQAKKTAEAYKEKIDIQSAIQKTFQTSCKKEKNMIQCY